MRRPPPIFFMSFNSPAFHPPLTSIITLTMSNSAPTFATAFHVIINLFSRIATGTPDLNLAIHDNASISNVAFKMDLHIVGKARLIMNAVGSL